MVFGVTKESQIPNCIKFNFIRKSLLESFFWKFGLKRTEYASLSLCMGKNSKKHTLREIKKPSRIVEGATAAVTHFTMKVPFCSLGCSRVPVWSTSSTQYVVSERSPATTRRHKLMLLPTLSVLSLSLEKTSMV